MLNGNTPKPDIGPKILTPQETWELIAAIVKASLTPPSELKDNGILKEHEAIPFRKSKALNRGCDGPRCHADPKLPSQPNWARSICFAPSNKCMKRFLGRRHRLTFGALRLPIIPNPDYGSG